MKSVDIHLSTLAAIPDEEISQSRRDVIRWISADGLDYLVVFDQGTPFEDGKWCFQVNHRSNGDSSPAKPRPPIPEGQRLEFKYTVYASNGWKLDPKVGVKP